MDWRLEAEELEITDPEALEKVFEIMGYKKEEIQENLGTCLKLSVLELLLMEELLWGLIGLFAIITERTKY